MPRIFIASDHAGYKLKEEVKNAFPDLKLEDLGPINADRTDYPDWADKVAKKVARSEGLGILICGSGQGMAIRANRYPGVRAALCWHAEVAQLSRAHNDANILCFGERLVPIQEAVEIVRTFFSTDFEGGRHADRVKKLDRPLN